MSRAFCASVMVFLGVALFSKQPVAQGAIVFSEGHFYGAYDVYGSSFPRTVFEYDSAGVMIGSITLPTSYNHIRGIGFGPNNLLYVVSTDPVASELSGFTVRAIDSNGVIYESYYYPDNYLGGAQWHGKINFDASGHFYVNGLKGLVRFNLGEPDSGILFHSSTNGTYDAKCLLNGNILIADYNSLREYTGTGVYVRNINPAPAYAMNYLKGIEYDSESNSIFVAHSGTSADPRNFVKLDYTTGQFVSATEFRHGNDLVLATDGRIVAGSWSLRPGIFTQDPTQIGSFTGGNTNPMFVTQLVPEPASALFLGLAALAFRRRRR